MAKLFSVNMSRFDPYKNYRFLVYFGTSTSAVAGVSKIAGGLKRSSDVIDYKQGGDAIIRKGLGRTKYEAVTIERGVTHDADFEEWANAAQILDNGFPNTSLKELRRDVRIELLNEAGQVVQIYKLHNCWVSEFQAISDLDGGGNAILIEHIKIEHEGWERDRSLVEPKEI